MKIVKESLSPSEALYGFGGWLSTRDEFVTIGAHYDCAIVAELIDKFIVKQKIEEPKEHWEDNLVPMSESRSIVEDTFDVKGKIERSKKLPKEMKDKIVPLIIISGIHGTKYNKGVVTYLRGSMGSKLKGCGLGADKDGFFVMTHRARSKSYPEVNKIPQKDLNFIESTG